MLRTSTQNPAIHKAIDAVHALNADEALREKIRQRDKALRDYENEMAIARSEGIAEGRSERDAELAEKWRKKGYTEEQIKDLLGED